MRIRYNNDGTADAEGAALGDVLAELRRNLRLFVLGVEAAGPAPVRLVRHLRRLWERVELLSQAAVVLAMLDQGMLGLRTPGVSGPIDPPPAVDPLVGVMQQLTFALPRLPGGAWREAIDEGTVRRIRAIEGQLDVICGPAPAVVPGDPPPRRRRRRWLAEALLLVRDHPEWPDTEIARLVGVHRSQLSRSRVYQAAARLARAPRVDRSGSTDG
jgi:hypothetical protein